MKKSAPLFTVCVRPTLLLLLLLSPLYALSQDDSPETAAAPPRADWQEALRQWMTAEDMEADYGAETMEQLAELADNPLNLNATSRQELELLPFLSAQQVEALVEYIDRYHPVRSLAELQMIRTLDYDTRRLLQCFVYVGQEKPKSPWPRMSDVMKYGQHSLTATAKLPLYDRRGDRNGYLGYKYRHDLRYQFRYGDRIRLGITGAQDSGEPFLANGNRQGYDHYSYYLQLRHMGRLEELNLGTYRVQMGMGLVMNTAFSLGKLTSLQQMGRTTHALTAHASRSAAGYMQGAAATVRLADRWRMTAFASFRYVDATLNADGSARTIVTSGYHRTPTEMGKKNNTAMTDAGLSLGWRRGTLHVTANAVMTHLDRRLTPQTNTLYRRYAAQGSNFINASLDYGYNNHRWTLAGETAINGEGAIAALHTASCRLTDQLTLMTLHRYYDKRYTALHASAFSEGGHVQNEHGIYAGATWRPARPWQLQAYIDYAHFAWARYLVSAASDALDVLASIRHERTTWSIEGRYRMHLRQRNNAEKTALQNRPEHRLRLRAQVAPHAGLMLQTEANASMVGNGAGYSRGIMVGQQAAWQHRALRIDATAGWFRTDDYDARLYQYERSVAHDFSFPMYYGHGIRLALNIRASLGTHLQMSAKAGTTRYFDRSTISSGLQEISHSSQTDVLLQLRYKW